MKAAPGDTTWVQANKVNLTYYNNYDTTVFFPSSVNPKTYRKILMIFTLGKYRCAPGTQYCGDWDYTVQNYLMPKTGDTLELGRLITPYADSAAPRTPFGWTQRYYFDVTDYYSRLQDTAKMRIHYSGYSGGFTANIKFMFIEGTPERNVTGIQRLWTPGSYTYGKASDPINNHFSSLSKTAPANTQSALLKMIVTGHGDDSNGCCEFMSHAYQVKMDAAQVDQYTIWRDNCPSNELYPQSGTWLYERGNWCPGALVYANYHALPGFTAGSTHNLGISFDPYTTGVNYGVYTTEASVIYYAGFNKTLDASLENVIAPTANENFFRENPSAGNPMVIVRNSGSSVINSIQLSYNVKDSVTSSYTWNGTLLPLHDTVISLPPLPAIARLDTTGNGLHRFEARIVNVNNTTDDDSTNNKIYSDFIVAPKWPSKFIVAMNTNNEALGGSGTQSETSWRITDLSGNVVASRTNASISHLYNDTVSITTPGVYQLVVADSGCDGLYWWANPSNVTAGSITIKKTTSVLSGGIPLHGNAYTGNYANDFGCGFMQYFTVTSVPATAVSNLTTQETAIKAYPNPAQNAVQVNIEGIQDVKGTLQVFDALGRTVLTAICDKAQNEINISSLVNGAYSVVFTDNHNTVKLQTRLMVIK
ncbi:peptide-N-glycosidase F-related protein [Chitinophagaceae bacterium MMS25-I14]